MTKITPGHIFAAGEECAPEMLNTLVAEATISDIAIESISGLEKGLEQKADAGVTRAQLAGKAEHDHTHEVADIDGLQDAIEKPHTHPIDGVTGLRTALSGKAAQGHGHTAEDVDGLPDRLHRMTTDLGQISGEVDAVAGRIRAQDADTRILNKADAGHKHAVVEVGDLQAALNNRSETRHDHDLRVVTDYASVASTKAQNGHRHSVADITGRGDTSGYSLLRNATGDGTAKRRGVYTMRAVVECIDDYARMIGLMR